MAPETELKDSVGFPGDADFVQGDDQWETAYEDSGSQIQWDQTPEFIGTYLGSEIMHNVEGLNGESKDVELLKFTDPSGKNVCAFANYALTEAFKDGKVPAGKRVKIVNHGKESIKDGKQTMNRMSVYVAK